MTLLPVALLCLTGQAREPEVGEATRLSEYNLSRGGLAIKGYDPVSYFQGTPTKGNKKFTYLYRGLNYRFSSQDNLQKFQSDPAGYEPEFGGWCAWAMYDGGKRAGINPKSYLIVDGKLYLFYDTFVSDTRKLWLKRSKTVEQQEMIETGVRYWRKQITP